jgi:hypothetical protein
MNKPRAVKKQTRRRMHTSRPYQEGLLNMAEARREIVTALRIHRANMRQQQSKFQQEQQRQQQPRLQLQQPAHQVMVFQEQSQAFEGVPVPVSYANSLSNSSHLLTGAPAGNYYSSSVLSCDLTPVEEEAPAAAIGAQLEQLACGLSAQPLGLNLSFHGFGGSLDNVKIGGDSFGGPLIQSSSCPPSSYSAYSSLAGDGSLVHRATDKYSSADAPASLSQVLDSDGEMLYSIVGDGERQGGVELSETSANVATASAWWTKILESMESDGGESTGALSQTTGPEAGTVDDAVAGWPEWQWLCDGGVSVEQEITAAGSKPDVLETMHADDGEHGCCCEGGRGDSGGRGVALPW